MRHVVSTVIRGALLVIMLGSAVAGASEGPPTGPFYDNDRTWVCGPDGGLPPYHCLNIKSKGNTGLIMVFYPDPRWPAEGISFDPKADHRPCPHDPAATDGTWWSPFPGAYVCHHRP
jgi:hypothetical protein